LLGIVLSSWCGRAHSAYGTLRSVDGMVPSWWGGSLETLDSAFAAAVDWAKATEVSPSIQGRAWTTADGRWGVGAAMVRAASRGSSEMAEELRQSEQEAVELAARDRALRAAAVLLTAGGDPVAVQGRAGRLWRARGAFEIRARLDPAPRTRLYEASGRLYAIALIDVSSVRSLSLGGEDVAIGAELSAFRDWGLVEIAATASDATVVEAALREATAEADEAPFLIAAAATAVDRGRPDLAAPWVAKSLARPLDVGELLQSQRVLARSLGLAAPLVERLASAPDLDARLAIIGDAWMDVSGAESARSAFVLVDGRPIELSIRRVPDPDDGEFREAAAFAAIRALGDGAAAGRTPSGTIAADGSVLAKERPPVEPAASETGSITIAHGGQAVVAHRGGESAEGSSSARFVPVGVPAADRRGDWPSRRRTLVRAAIVQWCLDTCRIEALSSGQVDAAFASGDPSRFARWVVPEGDAVASMHRVLLDEAAIEALIEASLPDASVSVVVAESGGNADGTASDRREALRLEVEGSLAASGWRISSSRDGANEVVLELDVQLERGEEPGSFGKPKPFVEPVVSARLSALGEPIPDAAARAVGRRVFGIHSPAAATIEAERAAVASLAKVASEALRRHRLRASGVIGPDGRSLAGKFDRRWWDDLARRCEVDSPLEGEEPRWPGGGSGLVRFCEAVAPVAPLALDDEPGQPPSRGRP